MTHDWKIIREQTVGSTNDYLHQMVVLDTPDNLTVVVAQVQTKGRGHHDAVWESEAGKNLTFSIFFKPAELPAKHQFVLSQALSLGICSAIEKVCNVKPAIKWPNDIYIDNRKLCGILIENSIMGNCIDTSIMGVGINVNQEAFVSDAQNPISLKQFMRIEYDLDKLLQTMLSEIKIRFDELENGFYQAIDEAYCEKLYRRGEWSFFDANGNRFKACITGVSEFGELMVIDEKGMPLMFGHKEIQFVL